MSDPFDDIVNEHSQRDLPTSRRVPEILYHYTNAAGLEGVLKSGLLWATDYRFLNDATKLAHTNAIINEVSRLRSKNTAANSLARRLYGRVDEVQEIDNKEDRIFVYSLSEEADSLSQWRGYAEEGRGFTIGFSGESLRNQASKPNAEFGLRQVEYDHDIQRAKLEKASSEVENRLRSNSRQRGVDRDQIIEQAASAINTIAVELGTANKHKSFASEREWRLVSFVYDPKTEIKVRARGAELAPYIHIKAHEKSGPRTGRLPIVRIGVGPGFPANNQREAVESLCLQYGYDVEIYAADTPFRRG